MKKKGRNALIWISVAAALIFSIIFGVVFGSADLNAETVFKVLSSKIAGSSYNDLSANTIYIVWNLRMPRAVAAVAVGGGLAVSGVAMQAITQNVLAEPYILGVSSGASAAVCVAFFLGGTFAHTSSILQIFAFAGALGAMLLVYAAGTSGGRVTGTRLVLAGMAVSIILNAVSQFFITLSTAQETRSVMLWMMGSLATVRWNSILLPLIGSAAGLLFFGANAGNYDLISLSDETAVSLGVNVVRLKKLTMIVGAFVTGLAVSACGLIGLVGFVVPHIIRMTIGSRHRRLIPLSFLTGGIFLLWMDILARCVMAPGELPVGIFTALCGGPFFIFLLYRQSKNQGV